MTANRWTFVGAVAMAAAVGLGAFGAHGLKRHLTDEALAWWNTGVRYHAWHALGLLVVDRFAQGATHRLSLVAGSLFTGGIMLFSGSLYTLALTDMRWLGMVTPLGGTAWIVGWIALALAARKASRA